MKAIAKGLWFDTFPKNNSPKENVKARMDFYITYNDNIVLNASHYALRTFQLSPLYIYIYIYIGLVSRVFANGPGDRDSMTRSSHTKD